jgi:hypothetical protein
MVYKSSSAPISHALRAGRDGIDEIPEAFAAQPGQLLLIHDDAAVELLVSATGPFKLTSPARGQPLGRAAVMGRRIDHV